MIQTPGLVMVLLFEKDRTGIPFSMAIGAISAVWLENTGPIMTSASAAIAAYAASAGALAVSI